MPKYRKKPVVIEAVQIVPGFIVPNWWRAAYKDGVVMSSHSGGFDILTKEGVMHADPGDWIIQGVAGELYPCKPEIFLATYDPLEEVRPTPHVSCKGCDKSSADDPTVRFRKDKGLEVGAFCEVCFLKMIGDCRSRSW